MTIERAAGFARSIEGRWRSFRIGFPPRYAEVLRIAQPNVQRRELECKRELIGDLSINGRPAVKDVTLH